AMGERTRATARLLGDSWGADMKTGMPGTLGEAMRIHVKAFLRSTMLSSIVGAAYLSCNPAYAIDSADSARPSWIDPSWYAPAVDGVNGRIEGWGGTLHQESFRGVQGALRSGERGLGRGGRCRGAADG